MSDKIKVLANMTTAAIAKVLEVRALNEGKTVEQILSDAGVQWNQNIADAEASLKKGHENEPDENQG